MVAMEHMEFTLVDPVVDLGNEFIHPRRIFFHFYLFIFSTLFIFIVHLTSLPN